MFSKGIIKLVVSGLQNTMNSEDSSWDTSRVANQNLSVPSFLSVILFKKKKKKNK